MNLKYVNAKVGDEYSDEPAHKHRLSRVFNARTRISRTQYKQLAYKVMLSRLFLALFQSNTAYKIDSEHTRCYTKLFPVWTAEILQVTVTAPTAQLMMIECPLSEREVVGLNPVAPVQRCKNATSSSLTDARINGLC